MCVHESFSSLKMMTYFLFLLTSNDDSKDNMNRYIPYDNTIRLKNNVFPDIQRCYKDHKWLCECAILAPKNDSVNVINIQIQQQLPGEDISYKSIDTVVDIDQAVQYPTEVLNSLEPPGMPSHRLALKIGSSIMLLRNLDAPRLCNGARLYVKNLMPHVIEATILTGCAKGEDVHLYHEFPWFPMICHLSSSVFSFQYVLLFQCLSIKLKVNHLKLLVLI